MKTIILATDFSENANDAVSYGYAMAQQIRANVMLCNAMIIPAEIPQAGIVSWPEQEFDQLMADSKNELDRLKAELESTVLKGGFKPQLICVSQAGMVTDVIKSLGVNFNNSLIILGTHRGGFLGRFLTGNHAELVNGCSYAAVNSCKTPYSF
jgi:nucleotide-binding universal stress UspA family protein